MSDDLSLWRAVISQAFADAATTGMRRETVLERSDARHWLTTPSQDFHEVCALADLEPTQVRTLAIKHIAEADADTKGENRGHLRGRVGQLITDANGESLTVAQWAERLGIAENTITHRLRKGLPIEQMLAPRFEKARAHA
ncbi:hypothetical protein [Methylobacterium durans]|uniref:hypothetical protein n=1 Tax=Methylobacterium durans TaxID=2202825 RepID=UPI0013A55610|nr:hypothetical protein [Methylobacterium durans]